MHVSDEQLSGWIKNYEGMGVPAPGIAYDLRDARAEIARLEQERRSLLEENEREIGNSDAAKGHLRVLGFLADRYAAALRRIAGDGDELAGIHIVDPGDSLGHCNFECEWWCDRHGCVEDDPAVCSDEDDCRLVYHIHCAEGCPTRIALEALSGTNEGEGT